MIGPSVWLMLAVLLTTPEVPATNVLIRLRAEGIVAGNLITLGEVAQIVTNDAEREMSLAALQLGPAPAQGEAKWLEMHDIRDDLYRKGINLATIEFSGSRRVEVKRPDVPLVVSVVESAPKEAKDWNAVLTGMIEKNIQHTGPWAEGMFHVKLLGDRAIDHLKQTKPEHWELVVPSQWKMGRQGVSLEIPSGEGKSTFGLEVIIEVDQPIVITTRAIDRGAKIGEADVRVVARRAAKVGNEDYIVRIEDVIGKEAMHPIAVDQAVLKQDVRAEPIVFRGSTVTVWIRQGTAEIQLSAVAQEDGGMGEWITAVNPTTNRKLTHKIRVIGAQMTELPQNAPPIEGATAGRSGRSRMVSRQGN